MSFITELKRRNVVKVASVYMVTAWLILQVIAVVSPYLKLPTAFGTGVTVVLIIGLPVACIFAWAFELTPEGVKPTRKVPDEVSIAHETGQKINRLLVTLIVLLIVYVAVDKIWFSTSPATAKPASVSSAAENQSVSAYENVPAASSELLAQNVEADSQAEEVKVLAVLPFLNLSTEEDQDIFVDGLTEELLNTLVRIRELKVLGRTSSFAYKGVNKDLKMIASELDAGYLIEGSVRKNGNNLRITVQLIEAETGSHLFSDNFDRTLKDIFTLQEEVSDQVAAALKLNLIHKDDRYSAALDKLSYIEVEQLVKARALANRQTSEGIKQAINILEELLQKYPDAPAILGLGAYVAMMEVSFTENASMSNNENIAMAERTLELDPLNRDALFTLAVKYDDYGYSVTKAQQLYRKAIRAYPYDYHFVKGYILTLVSSFTPCEQINENVSNLDISGVEEKLQNQIRYLILKCLEPDKAKKLLTTATTEDVDFFTVHLSFEAWFKKHKLAYEQNPNQRHIFSYITNLSLLEDHSTAQSLMSSIDMNSKGFWSTNTYLDTYFTPNQLPAIKFEELWERMQIKDHFELSSIYASILFDRAQKEEKLSELRKRFYELIPPENILPQIHSVAGYALILKKLGENQEATARAHKALNVLRKYKKQYPESYQFYAIEWWELELLIIAKEYEQASALLESYSYRPDLVWFDIPSLRYAYKDELGHPFFKEFFSQVELEKQKMREKLGVKI